MNRPKSIFRRAAEGGVTLGALFVCIFLAGSVAGTIGSLLSLALIVYVPVFVYRRLKSTYFAAHGLMTFSGLWLEGILHFICGAIILALGSLIFLRWIVPDYLPDMVAVISRAAAENAQASDSPVTPAQFASYFASIRPIDISMTLLWSASFTGSIASLVIAAIVNSKLPPPAPNS